MKRRLVFSPRAVADLEEIGDYIARDNLVRARTFVAELVQKCRMVSEAPEAYPTREELGRGLRIAIHRQYVVLFREVPDQDAVRVERVLHGARHLPRLLGG